MAADTTMRALEEYFRVNIEKKLKIPEQDEHQLTVGTKLLEIRREMQEVEAGLLAQKEEYSSKMESLQQRRDELGRKEAQLRDSLVKFDKFLKDNDAKKTRAVKKSHDERRLREQKEQEIVKLKDSMNTLTRRREKQEKGVDIHWRYQQFLEAALETVQYDEIKDLIARYDTLTATNSDLLDRAREAGEKSESERVRFFTMAEQKNTMLLHYNNQLAQLQTRLEEAQHHTQHWQAQYDLQLKNASQKSLLLGQIKMATNNLFTIVKSHLNSRMSNTTDTRTQLSKIEEFILDLDAITAQMQL